MEQIEYDIIDDTLYAYIPCKKFGEGCYESKPIINKDVFIECYKRWVIPEIEKEIKNDLV